MKPVPLSRYVLFGVIVAGGCAADLLTKHWMSGWLDPFGRKTWVWPGVFGFQWSLNQGALFGVGQGKAFLFAALSILAALAVCYWLFVARAARDLFLTIALSLVTAGILGNLYDRLGLHGLRWPYAAPGHAVGDPVYAVRDWVLVMIGDRQWPNFNVADSLLVCGALLLVWHSFYRGDSEAASL
jgi:signal peptidase II